MNRALSFGGMVGFLGLVAFSSGARADLVLSLNDTGTAGVDVIIADGRVAGYGTVLGATTHADTDGLADGVVSVPVGLMAGSFLVDPATSAFSMGGGVDDALVDLLLLVQSTAAVTTLEAMVTATDLTMDDPPTEIVADIGGFSSSGTATLTFEAAYDPANGQFSFPGGSTVGPATLGGGAFNTSLTTRVTPASPFSLSERITITANSPGDVIGFDASNDATSVPEPGSVLLWVVASGVGVLVARRRARRKALTNGSAGLPATP